MALVFSDGFEHHNSGYNNYNILDTGEIFYLSNTASDLNAVISSGDVAVPPNGGRNGLRSIAIDRRNYVKLFLPNSAKIKKGIASTLYKSTTFLKGYSGYTVFGIYSGDSIIAGIRFLSYSTTFPDQKEVYELFAGGVQIGTFELEEPISSWERWSLVWDATGEAVEASLYRNNTLIISGAGGSSGVDLEAESIYFRGRGDGASTNNASDQTLFDSVTLWSDPVGDLNDATLPHWVDLAQITGPSTTTFNSWNSFYQGTSPFQSISSVITNFPQMLSSTDRGVKTDTPNDPLELNFIPGPILPTHIHGITSRIIGASNDALPNMSVRIDSGESSGIESVKDFSQGKSLAIVTQGLDPATGLNWNPGDAIEMVSASGSGGFEAGNNFAANGWSASNGTENAKFYVGPLGAIDGLNGAYISNDDGITANYEKEDSSGVHFYRDIIVPEGATQIIISFDYQLAGKIAWFYVSKGSIEVIPAAGSNYNAPPSGFTSLWSKYFIYSGSQAFDSGKPTLSIPVSSGDAFRLCFTWVSRNLNLNYGEPPTSVCKIDNIKIIAYSGISGVTVVAEARIP